MKKDEGRYAALWAGAAKTARLMVGIPDYDTYVAHRRAIHPGDRQRPLRLLLGKE
jgi:uncharacterized short protein YbdD (DUF466 family)